MPETRFMVRVSRGNGDWLVTVDCQDGSEYAKALAPNLDVALRMAVPYMAYAAEPDPFARLAQLGVDDAEGPIEQRRKGPS